MAHEHQTELQELSTTHSGTSCRETLANAVTHRDHARLEVVRKMYDMRFGEPVPQRRSVDRLRGIEGARVKRLYPDEAQPIAIPEVPSGDAGLRG